MNHLRMLGLAAVAAMTMVAVTAGTATATTLEGNGVAQNQSVAFSLSLETQTSLSLRLTNGTFANTCTMSEGAGKTSTFTAENSKAIGGPISSLTFTSCTTSPIVVDKAGNLSVEWISGTTNGTVRSVGAEVTVPSAFGTLNCKTGAGTQIGILTGKKAGEQALLDMSAVVSCGFLVPSALWTGGFSVTSPTGLGVVK